MCECFEMIKLRELKKIKLSILDVRIRLKKMKMGDEVFGFGCLLSEENINK